MDNLGHTYHNEGKEVRRRRGKAIRLRFCNDKVVRTGPDPGTIKKEGIMLTRHKKQLGATLASAAAIWGMLSGAAFASSVHPASTGGLIPISMFGTFPYDVGSLTNNKFTTFAENLTGLKFNLRPSPLVTRSPSKRSSWPVVPTRMSCGALSWVPQMSSNTGLKASSSHCRT